MKKLLLIFTILISLNLRGIEDDFKSNVRIKGKNIFLNDIIQKDKFSKNDWTKISKIKISEFKDGEIFLNINSKLINTKLKPYKIKLGNGFITVRRFKYFIPEEDLKNKIRTFLSNKYDLKNNDKIEFISLPKIFSYHKEYILDFEEIDSGNFKQLRIKGQIIDGEFNYQPKYFSVIIKKLLKCYVVTRQIKPKEIIRIGRNVKEENRYFTLNNNAVHSLSIFKDVESIKYLRKNQIIKINSVRKIPDVKRNSKIKVMVKSGIINIETQAKATTDGYIGDVIAFRNIESNKKFKAKIIKKNLAIVKF